MSVISTVKTDRLLLMYGGMDGQTIFDDVWQYNINSNMWYKSEIPERRLKNPEFNLKNCTDCKFCAIC